MGVTPPPSGFEILRGGLYGNGRPVDVPKGSDIILRQGQTAGPYGNDPNYEPKGAAARLPRDLKPS